MIEDNSNSEKVGVDDTVLDMIINESNQSSKPQPIEVSKIYESCKNLTNEEVELLIRLLKNI